MKLKNIFLSAIAVLGMVTQAFAKSNAAKNTDNNVPSGSEQVAEHDLKVYGSNYTDGAKNVLRVKSAFKSFRQETNLSVICNLIS